MSIYIKGMEMPTSCEKCPFLDYEEGFCFASGVKGKSGWYEFTWCPSGIKDGRHKDCPLVPVPEHGDLIDRDALLDTATIHWSQTTNESCFPIDEIEYAPTIIPASKEGE